MFNAAVRALHACAEFLGITYEEINVWIFCIGWPLSMIVAAIWIYQLRRKVARIDRNRGKGAIRTFQEHNAVAVCHLCVMDETPHPSTKQISS